VEQYVPARFTETMRLVCEGVFREIRHRRVGPPTCDLFLFSEVISEFNGTRVGAVKAKTTEIVDKLRELNLRHCFEQWTIPTKRCSDRQGE